jgi:small subunit ribosomal protein S17
MPEQSTAAPGAASSRGHGTTKVGVVTSDRMTKTVVVSVERLVKHPIYKRFVKQTSRFMAHDEKQECRVGDTVEIVESRPLSAKKRWRVRRIVTRGVRVEEPVPAGRPAKEAGR